MKFGFLIFWGKSAKAKWWCHKSWKKNNEKHHNLHFLHNIVTYIKGGRMKQVVHVACRRKVRNIYKILVGKPQGKRQETWE